MLEKGFFPVSEFKAACLAAEAAIELLDLARTNEEWDLSTDAVRETFLFTQEIFELTGKLDSQDVCRFHAIRDIAKRHLIHP